MINNSKVRQPLHTPNSAQLGAGGIYARYADGIEDSRYTSISSLLVLFTPASGVMTYRAHSQNRSALRMA
jgi:hypothetical protein